MSRSDVPDYTPTPMDELTRNFAKNVRVLRLSNKMSQAKLANRASVSVSYISQLELARRSPPLPMVARFAKALKVRPLYLLQELELPDPPIDLRFAIGPPPKRR